MSVEAILTDVETFLKGLKEKFSPAVQAEVKAVENEGHAIVTDAVTYIKANGLADLEALAITFVSALIPGGSWVTMLGALKAQAVTDGITLIEGAEAVVAAKVQADLLVQGKTPAPVNVPATTTA